MLSPIAKRPRPTSPAERTADFSLEPRAATAARPPPPDSEGPEMNLLRRTHPRLERGHAAGRVRVPGSLSLATVQETMASMDRHEPVTLSARTTPMDPYITWLERVTAQREAESQPVRWVTGAPVRLRSGRRAGSQRASC